MISDHLCILMRDLVGFAVYFGEEQKIH